MKTVYDITPYWGFNYMINSYKRIVRNQVKHFYRRGWTNSDIFNYYLNKLSMSGTELIDIIEK